ncbi:MAG: DoxX family protein [Bacteroidaceae bacterium]|nr:DoxX family protein [Bacteroidales bacterium]MBQ2978603.1 DoxX family protein [Bacteroidaceae bacterium]
MSYMIAFLFPRYANKPMVSLLLLALRLIFGVLFMIHGVDKMLNFATLSQSFPDVTGMGSSISLMVTIFIELFCSLAFIVGFMFRLVLLPMIASMFVAFFIIHRASVLQGELALIYLVVFLLLAVVGPGSYSIDNPLGAYVIENRKCKEALRSGSESDV